MAKPKPRATNDPERISALSDEAANKLLQKETFRVRTKEIIEEYLDSVPCMEKVQKYAGMEIDKRLYKSIVFWLTLIGVAIITNFIANWLSGIVAN